MMPVGWLCWSCAGQRAALGSRGLGVLCLLRGGSPAGAVTIAWRRQALLLFWQRRVSSCALRRAARSGAACFKVHLVHCRLHLFRRYIPGRLSTADASSTVAELTTRLDRFRDAGITVITGAGTTGAQCAAMPCAAVLVTLRCAATLRALERVLNSFIARWGARSRTCVATRVRASAACHQWVGTSWGPVEQSPAALGCRPALRECHRQPPDNHLCGGQRQSRPDRGLWLEQFLLVSPSAWLCWRLPLPHACCRRDRDEGGPFLGLLLTAAEKD